jgi:hypothetical protein
MLVLKSDEMSFSEELKIEVCHFAGCVAGKKCLSLTDPDLVR